MERNRNFANCCLLHPFQPKRLFCFSCKYFYCHICCKENRYHDDHSAITVFIPCENIEFERYLGGSSNVCVFRATDLKDGHKYAVKLFSDVRCQWEIESLLQPPLNISHPNIIKYKGNYHNKEEGLFLVIRELADRSLQSEITDISPKKAFSYFIQIIEALRYLHDDLKIRHGNLKISNILLNQGGIVKLSDMDECNNILHSKMINLRSNRGFDTEIYLPPEVINGQENNEKSDIWAAGIIFHILLSNGRHPFDIKGNKDEAEIVKNIKKGNIKFDLTHSSYYFLPIIACKNLLILTKYVLTSKNF